MLEIILLVIGLIVGAFLGYFIGKSSTLQKSDVSTQINTLQGLTTQIAEMKGKFEAVEKSREDLEKSRDKYNEEKEKRFKEFIENNQKLFKELKEGSDKSDKTKEEKIENLTKTNGRCAEILYLNFFRIFSTVPKYLITFCLTLPCSSLFPSTM